MLHTWLVNFTSLGLSSHTQEVGTTVKWESIRERKEVPALDPGLLEILLKCLYRPETTRTGKDSCLFLDPRHVCQSPLLCQ